MVDGFDCYFAPPDVIKANWPPRERNTETLGELLHQFFKHYAHFNYKRNVVQIRNGKALTKMEKNWTVEEGDTLNKNYMTVEDPFETTHNLGRGVVHSPLLFPPF